MWPIEGKKFVISQLNAADDRTFYRLLSNIFENSPWVAQRVLNKRPFASIERLHADMADVVLKSSQEEQLALIRSHPDLAGKAAQAGEITQESKREQRGAGLEMLTNEECEEFHKLNKNYKERFGFPYVVAVRGFGTAHNKESILHDMHRRLKHSVDDEIREALKQINRIAELRLADLLGE